MTKFGLSRRLAAEFIGTLLLLAAVVGSGIMGEKLAAGNTAIALLANSIATGAILYVLISMLAPVSGAHFNPAVTLVMRLRGEIQSHAALSYCGAQFAGALAGVLAAHAMFELPLLQTSMTARTGAGQWLAEGIATFGLVLTILGLARFAAERTAGGVALYILSAYWFTASTSFANPAVTIARGFTNTFAGIQPAGIGGFVAAQVLGAIAGYAVALMLFDDKTG